MNAVTVRDLCFRYKDQATLIHHLNLTIQEGCRLGILGPNGAGKTTLMNLMTGLLPCQQGSIEIFGKNVRIDRKEVHAMIGLVPQDFSFYEDLSPAENLEFFGAWYGLSSARIKKISKELLAVMGLEKVANRQVKSFSGGMKRRVNLSIGVMNSPKLLFLDEPTVGVDVQSGNAIITYLKEINRRGTTLIYTSHQLKEAEDLCNSIVLLDQGKIIAAGLLSDLLKTHGHAGLEGLFLEITGRAYRD